MSAHYGGRGHPPDGSHLWQNKCDHHQQYSVTPILDNSCLNEYNGYKFDTHYTKI